MSGANARRAVWYTGLVVWISIVFGWGAMLYGNVRDKIVEAR
jgi:hypothetical protein